MQTALNHMTTPNLGYVDFLDLAKRLGCVGVEVRNDIARPLFDGIDPADAGAMADLSAVLSQLAAILNRGIYARIDDDTVIDVRDRLNQLIDASGGVL